MLGMTPTECLARHTHRQFLTWMAWIDYELNHPSRTDAYLMQISREIIKTPSRVWGKEPDGPSIEDMRITFSFKEDKPPTQEEVELTRRRRIEMEKASWLWAVGFRPSEEPKANGNRA